MKADLFTEPVIGETGDHRGSWSPGPWLASGVKENTPPNVPTGVVRGGAGERMRAEKILAPTDMELAASAQKDNEGAFAELVRRHMERAIQLAYVTVGNYEDARDISQEAFVKAHRALGRFQMKSQFSTWFYRILMNTAKDFMRKQKWKRFLTWKSQEEMETFFEKVEAPGEVAQKNVAAAELGTHITEAVAKLPIKQRWIFSLRYLEGLSLREIAVITGLTEGTIKAALHFAVQKFKKEMLPYLREGGMSYGF